MLKIKKILGAISLILVISCTLSACELKSSDISTGSTGENSESDLPELKIGVDDLKPFFYTDENGDYAGIDADIAIEACKRTGYKPDFVKITWTDRDNSLKNGIVDCIWNAFIKNDREDSYLWTETYMQSNLRILVDAKQNSDILFMNPII